MQLAAPGAQILSTWIYRDVVGAACRRDGAAACEACTACIRFGSSAGRPCQVQAAAARRRPDARCGPAFPPTPTHLGTSVLTGCRRGPHPAGQPVLHIRDGHLHGCPLRVGGGGPGHRRLWRPRHQRRGEAVRRRRRPLTPGGPRGGRACAPVPLPLAALPQPCLRSRTPGGTGRRCASLIATGASGPEPQ